MSIIIDLGESEVLLVSYFPFEQVFSFYLMWRQNTGPIGYENKALVTPIQFNVVVLNKTFTIEFIT